MRAGWLNIWQIMELSRCPVPRGTTLEEHEALRKLVELGRYDLLVMGGYSKPRWLELLFGGRVVDSHIVDNPPPYFALTNALGRLDTWPRRCILTGDGPGAVRRRGVR